MTAEEKENCLGLITKGNLQKVIDQLLSLKISDDQRGGSY